MSKYSSVEATALVQAILNCEKHVSQLNVEDNSWFTVHSFYSEVSKYTNHMNMNACHNFLDQLVKDEMLLRATYSECLDMGSNALLYKLKG